MKRKRWRTKKKLIVDYQLYSTTHQQHYITHTQPHTCTLISICKTWKFVVSKGKHKKRNKN